MYRSGRVLGLLRHGVASNSWMCASFEGVNVLQGTQTSVPDAAPTRSFSLDAFQATPTSVRGHDRGNFLWGQSGLRSCSSTPGERKSRHNMEFEDIMHKRRVFSKIMMRLATRYKTKLRRMEFREGVEADNAMSELGESFFNDCVDIVGRFRDDMDHINAATVIHRIGCIAICFKEKSWMVSNYQKLILDFANFLSQPERVDIMELRQAVMCFWGLSTFGPGMNKLKLDQNSDVTVEDCLRRLEAHLPKCGIEMRNGNNVCNMIEASAMCELPLEEATLDYLLDGAPTVIADEATSPQNVASLLWAMAKMKIEDKWGAVPTAIDVLSGKASKLRMDELAKVTKALGDMGVTDYARFMNETLKRVQVTLDHSEHLMSTQDVADFATGLASLNFESSNEIMEYLVSDIKRRRHPLSSEQMDAFKAAAEKLGFAVGSLEREPFAEAA
ncbi:hypothetical protein BSKO_04165 [Bryopsis sp. KO-2023]|nr:hypothetical protein BSKO_04165 [Bryopsis sp. KO-2023]